MKRIATIRTKFDLTVNWKKWKQAANYTTFLEDHKDKWEKILIGVTKAEIQGFLWDKGIELQKSMIDIKITKNERGCWEILGDVFVYLQDLTTAYTIVDMGCKIIGIIRENKEDLKERLEGKFAEELNERAEQCLESDTQPEGDIIKIQEFNIEPADVNE
jgi:hypothetical protein